MMRRCLILLTIFVVVLLPVSAGAQSTLPPWRQELPEGREKAIIVVGETEVVVDLAITPRQQQLGLGYRNGLADDTGMFFVGTRDEMKVFWMKGMRFCLDIIWIQGDRIVGAAENACPDPEGTADADRVRYPSTTPATHVLEMNAGWLDAHGYGPGTIVDLSQVPGLGD